MKRGTMPGTPTTAAAAVDAARALHGQLLRSGMPTPGPSWDALPQVLRDELCAAAQAAVDAFARHARPVGPREAAIGSEPSGPPAAIHGSSTRDLTSAIHGLSFARNTLAALLLACGGTAVVEFEQVGEAPLVDLTYEPINGVGIRLTAHRR